MSLLDLAVLLLAVLGIVMFLYGANYYDQVVGWAGVALIVVAIFVEIGLKVHGSTRKKGERLESVKL